MPKGGHVRAEPDREPRVQVAALPWRRVDGGGLEVLLITSRETRRWVIPKGWPIKGMTSHRAAEREAYEEAGVRGEVAKQKLGVYHYEKRLRSGRMQTIKVTVYPLQVASEGEAFPEADQREKLWAEPGAAADLVQEPDLAKLLRRFKPK